jgi:hypothetical protein
MICDYETKITINDVEYEIECEIEFSVFGRYYPATYESPAEFPELDIEEVTVTRMWVADEDDNVVEIECPESYVSLIKKIIREDEKAQEACQNYYDRTRRNRD